MVAPAIAFQPYSKLYIVLRQQTDKLEFGELTTHTVILSEARSAKSKNLRTYQLHCTKQVRRSFDSLTLAQDDNRGTNSNLSSI